ncbi:MAG: hypothetical protein C0404_03145 [Verrucomicrobia bacterium]|nr:hypothetical protein [Verrucomicrobiota bacterium]
MMGTPESAKNHEDVTGGPGPEGERIPDVLRRGMRAAIVGSCFKVLSSLSFVNGLMLVYLSALNLDGPTVISLLSLVSVLQAFCLIPFAHLADCAGKKLVTMIGIALCGIGFALFPMVGLFPGGMMVGVLGAGICLYGVGLAGQMAGWFALLSPLVPSFYRGRFFGALRVSWQLCGVAVAAIIAFLLPRETSVPMLTWVLIVVGISILPWAVFYTRIPELEREQCSTRDLPAALMTIARSAGYLPFCAYLFIIHLFVGGCPVLFGLIEKRVLAMGDGTVVLLANVTMIGSVLGFYLGGKAVDRVGTKPVFLVCHFGYGITLALFVIRDLFPVPVFPILAVVHAMFGLLVAAGSIAFSTEMLALIPAARKSLTTSICSTMIQGGSALSGLLGAWGISMGLFSSSWMLSGSVRSAYDVVLLIYAAMIVLMTVTLGLIPSVVGRPELRGGSPVA